MRLATVRTTNGTRAVRLDGEHHVDLGFSDVGALLAHPDWRHRAAASDGARTPASDADFGPVVVRPTKILCVGHNYSNHIREMGREMPSFPTLFAKFAESL
ncbi:MAG: 2-hydroxyhepta-2,4-diene-1,7-dioate isomerase, partial [Mycobacterium sp.]